MEAGGVLRVRRGRQEHPAPGTGRPSLGHWGSYRLSQRDCEYLQVMGTRGRSHGSPAQGARPELTTTEAPARTPAAGHRGHRVRVTEGPALCGSGRAVNSQLPLPTLLSTATLPPNTSLSCDPRVSTLSAAGGSAHRPLREAASLRHRSLWPWLGDYCSPQAENPRQPSDLGKFHPHGFFPKWALKNQPTSQTRTWLLGFLFLYRTSGFSFEFRADVLGPFIIFYF